MYKGSFSPAGKASWSQVTFAQNDFFSGEGVGIDAARENPSSDCQKKEYIRPNSKMGPSKIYSSCLRLHQTTMLSVFGVIHQAQRRVSV